MPTPGHRHLTSSGPGGGHNMAEPRPGPLPPLPPLHLDRVDSFSPGVGYGRHDPFAALESKTQQYVEPQRPEQRSPSPYQQQFLTRMHVEQEQPVADANMQADDSRVPGALDSSLPSLDGSMSDTEFDFCLSASQYGSQPGDAAYGAVGSGSQRQQTSDPATPPREHPTPYAYRAADGHDEKHHLSCAATIAGMNQQGGVATGLHDYQRGPADSFCSASAVTRDAVAQRGPPAPQLHQGPPQRQTVVHIASPLCALRPAAIAAAPSTPAILATLSPVSQAHSPVWASYASPPPTPTSAQRPKRARPSDKDDLIDWYKLRRDRARALFTLYTPTRRGRQEDYYCNLCCRGSVMFQHWKKETADGNTHHCLISHLADYHFAAHTVGVGRDRFHEIRAAAGRVGNWQRLQSDEIDRLIAAEDAFRAQRCSGPAPSRPALPAAQPPAELPSPVTAPSAPAALEAGQPAMPTAAEVALRIATCFRSSPSSSKAQVDQQALTGWLHGKLLHYYQLTPSERCKGKERNYRSHVEEAISLYLFQRVSDGMKLLAGDRYEEIVSYHKAVFSPPSLSAMQPSWDEPLTGLSATIEQHRPAFFFDLVADLLAPVDASSTLTVKQIAQALACRTVVQKLEQWETFQDSMLELQQWIRQRVLVCSPDDCRQKLGAMLEPVYNNLPVHSRLSSERQMQSVYLLAMTMLCTAGDLLQPNTCSQRASDEQQSVTDDKDSMPEFELAVLRALVASYKECCADKSLLLECHPIAKWSFFYMLAGSAKRRLLLELQNEHEFASLINDMTPSDWTPLMVCLRRAGESRHGYDVEYIHIAADIVRYLRQHGASLTFRPDQRRTELGLAVQLYAQHFSALDDKVADFAEQREEKQSSDASIVTQRECHAAVSLAHDLLEVYEQQRTARRLLFHKQLDGTYAGLIPELIEAGAQVGHVGVDGIDPYLTAVVSRYDELADYLGSRAGSRWTQLVTLELRRAAEGGGGGGVESIDRTRQIVSFLQACRSQQQRNSSSSAASEPCDAAIASPVRFRPGQSHTELGLAVQLYSQPSSSCSAAVAEFVRQREEDATKLEAPMTDDADASAVALVQRLLRHYEQQRELRSLLLRKQQCTDGSMPSTYAGVIPDLVAAHAQVNCNGVDGVIPIVLTAVQAGCVELVEYLVFECKADVNVSEPLLRGRSTCLHVAVRRGDLPMTRLLLRVPQLKLDALNDSFKTPDARGLEARSRTTCKQEAAALVQAERLTRKQLQHAAQQHSERQQQ